VRASCCKPGRFFATAAAAGDWHVQHPRGTVLPVADAYPQLDALRSRLLDRGDHELKGVPGPWHVFAVDDSRS
jgi:class 3 adenylate cyclase